MSPGFAYELQMAVTKFEGGLVNDIRLSFDGVSIGEIFLQTASWHNKMLK